MAAPAPAPAFPFPPLPPAEGPVQIIALAADGTFELNERKLAYVLDQVPPGMKVAVVSVVGAFRTGKSFLLDLFLRYLRHYDARARAGEAFPSAAEVGSGSAEWLFSSGDTLEGNGNGGAPTHAPSGAGSGGRTGFKWRAGNERTTTGMWVWGSPFVRPLPGSGEPVAVLLMDTQGMFDLKTSQMSTAQIFGLSTLISSYQVYNVMQRIQEDNLQHVALFVEYARIAARAEKEGGVGEEEEEEGEEGDGKGERGGLKPPAVVAPVAAAGVAAVAGVAPPSPVPSSVTLRGIRRPASRADDEDVDSSDGVAALSPGVLRCASAASPLPAAPPATPHIERGLNRADQLRKLALASTPHTNSRGAEGGNSSGGGAASPMSPPHPDAASFVAPVFQRIEFLIRDAIINSSGGGGSADAEAAAAREMSDYLNSVFDETAHEDLRTTREQILACFASISCYMLPHPGFKVTEAKQYDGNILDIRDSFRLGLERYVHIVFSEQLEPKSLHGRALTGVELKNFIAGYVRVFREAKGDARFPEARVLLTATAEANNLSAHDIAQLHFETALDAITTSGAAFLPHDELARAGAAHHAAAVDLFERTAGFGPRRAIRKMRKTLEVKLKKRLASALEHNRALDPQAKLSPIAAFAVIWLVMWLLRFVLDFSCSSWVPACSRAASAAGFIQFLAFVGICASLYNSGGVTAATWARMGAVAAAAGVPFPVAPAAGAPRATSSAAGQLRAHTRASLDGGGGGSEGDAAAAAAPTDREGLRKRVARMGRPNTL